MSLKQKTIHGLSWAFIDRFANQISQFIFGIILARLLSPAEYGLIGMLAIFFEVADTFVMAGFSEALIRKTEPSEKDYSTVFLVNVGTGIFFYAILCALAPGISWFFNEQQLTPIIWVMGSTIVINALSMVARVPLTKHMNFKVLATISVIANIVSGAVAIVLAFKGYGVWSLVWRNIVYSIVNTLMTVLLSRPKFGLQFSRDSFREIFGFGSKLLASRLFLEFYNNLYYLLIGKFFSARDLGLYTRANGYKDMFSRTLHNVIQSVSFPALSGIKDDNARLKNAYRKLVQSTTYLTAILMFGLAAASDNFILGLIGPNWADAIPYLQLLSIVGIFYPLHYINLNILVIKGQSGKHLKLEFLTKLIAVPALVTGFFFGIKAMIVCMIFTWVLDYLVTSSSSGRLIDYPVREQILDILPSFLFAILMGGVVWLAGTAMHFHPLAELLIQVALGALFTVTVSNQFRIKPFLEIKEIVLQKFMKKPALS
ncbi:MAG: lipopolysaccharide biosynthesis protein [Haliscomenobacteraceae bacterium CHB4]|nr:Teichuronic acid biosynthesis protein TuaB [Saprospiraceae bacterium]MCE7926236.1 lipopolysaccharide biosynthesis protein [Haliscomenobacteraceae bacterium CHB4]